MGLFGKRRGYEAPDYMTPGGGIGGDINRQQSESPLRDGGNWMRNLAMSLGAAQSFRDGDFNQGASLLDYVGQQGEAKRKAMQDEEQRRGLLRQLIAAGIPPEKAPLIIAGAAKYGDVAPGTTKAVRTLGPVVPRVRTASGRLISSTTPSGHSLITACKSLSQIGTVGPMSARRRRAISRKSMSAARC